MGGKKDMLTITEIASLRGVTSETMRYYDRIGLLKPAYIDPETKYRYYSIRQYERLGTIKELRELGMSIKEIQDYFNNRNLKKSAEILRHHYHLLQEDIRKKMMIGKVMAEKLHFLEDLDMAMEIEVVYETYFDDRYMITFGEPAGGPREHAFAFTKLENYLHETAPILASNRVGVYCDEKILYPSKGFIPSYPMILLENGDLDSKYKKKIDKGRYVCLDYKNGSLEQYHKSFDLIRDYLRIQDLEVSGKILQLYLIDKTLTDNPHERIMEIQVPVREKDTSGEDDT